MRDFQFEEPSGLSRESSAFISYLCGILSGHDVDRLQILLTDLVFCAENNGVKWANSERKRYDEQCK